MNQALTEAHSTYVELLKENPLFVRGLRQMDSTFNLFFQQIENAFTYLNEENLASATPPAPPNSAETIVASVHSEPTYEQPSADGAAVVPKDGTNAQQQLNLSDRSSVSPLKVAVDTSGSVVPSRTVHPTEDVEQRKRDVPTRPTAQPPKPPTNAEKSTSQSVDGGRSPLAVTKEGTTNDQRKESKAFLLPSKSPLKGTESRIRKPTESISQESHIPSPPKSKPPPPPAQSAKQGQGTSFGLVGSSPNRLPSGQNVCETAGTSSLKVEEDDYAEIPEPDEQNSAQKKKTTSIPISKIVTRRKPPRKDTEKK
ncbi:hypothetical protein niasHT_035096 [Heterodera trifolii]|uniref:Uncharacterized protein n=1 Tax=Heterodera trifolii TaxID=157864 RepID=A0ABD2IGX7_9BILA